jgi:hypothetical protein
VEEVVEEGLVVMVEEEGKNDVFNMLCIFFTIFNLSHFYFFINKFNSGRNYQGRGEGRGGRGEGILFQIIFFYIILYF